MKNYSIQELRRMHSKPIKVPVFITVVQIAIFLGFMTLVIIAHS